MSQLNPEADAYATGIANASPYHKSTAMWKAIWLDHYNFWINQYGI